MRWGPYLVFGGWLIGKLIQSWASASSFVKGRQILTWLLSLVSISEASLSPYLSKWKIENVV